MANGLGLVEFNLYRLPMEGVTRRGNMIVTVFQISVMGSLNDFYP